MGYKERLDTLKVMGRELSEARELFNQLSIKLDNIAMLAAEVYSDFDMFSDMEDLPDLSEVEEYLDRAEELLTEVRAE